MFASYSWHSANGEGERSDTCCGCFRHLSKSVWRRSITGAILSALNLSAAELLAEIGLTPDRVFAALQEGAAWAIPNIVLGSLVIVPIWFVTYLLRPPRN
jgi:hypothetical protein